MEPNYKTLWRDLKLTLVATRNNLLEEESSRGLPKESKITYEVIKNMLKYMQESEEFQQKIDKSLEELEQ